MQLELTPLTSPVSRIWKITYLFEISCPSCVTCILVPWSSNGAFCCEVKLSCDSVDKISCWRLMFEIWEHSDKFRPWHCSTCTRNTAAENADTAFTTNVTWKQNFLLENAQHWAARWNKHYSSVSPSHKNEIWSQHQYEQWYCGAQTKRKMLWNVKFCDFCQA